MSDSTQPNTAASDLQVLERKIERLIRVSEALTRENKALKNQQQNWSTERAQLLEKNAVAKAKVEAMISRLKALETE